jgi:cytoskeletal protein CcmA (bactofilin family)
MELIVLGGETPRFRGTRSSVTSRITKVRAIVTLGRASRSHRKRHARSSRAETQGRPATMLQSSDAQKYPTPANTFAPVKTASVPTEQATIGRSLVIKGEVTGSESLFIDGRIEGTINFADHRVTVGRNGNVAASINAKEVVIMGKVNGNVTCTDRVDIRAEGSLTGDVTTHRISVEDGAVLTGSVQVRAADQKQDKNNSHSEQPKAAAAAAGN